MKKINYSHMLNKIGGLYRKSKETFCVILLSIITVILFITLILMSTNGNPRVTNCFQTCGNSGPDCQITARRKMSTFSIISIINCFIVSVISLALLGIFIKIKQSKKIMTIIIFLLSLLILLLQLLWSSILVDIGMYQGSLANNGNYYSQTKYLSRYNSFYCESQGVPASCIVSLVFSLFVFFLSIFSLGYHYIYYSTLEGKSIQEYVKDFIYFVINKIKGTPAGFRYAKDMFKKLVIKVKLDGTSHYRELEIPERSYHCLIQTITKEFDNIEIVEILKDEDTVVRNDANVRRLDNFTKLIVITKDSQDDFSDINYINNSSNNNNNNNYNNDNNNDFSIDDQDLIEEEIDFSVDDNLLV
eukprot:TRINITY_DN2990_c0_g1_i1.p1 TRINITY_DN2990_c0_g1~~TRINITY_DN2990_c0_g1_i1.p1  ORF type:complete len:359 (-),score=50.50 TRINITY_DN2990_c0_g1_i1:158-1234(-)